MSDELAYFNGIDGTTGRYLLPPMPAATLAQIALGKTLDGGLSDLKTVAARRRVGDYAITAGRDPTSLASAGWGLITPARADPKRVAAILEALTPLRDLRREQAGPLYKEFTGPAGYRAGSQTRSSPAQAVRQGQGRVGPVDPNRSRTTCSSSPTRSRSVEFQYQLDVQYAVGRICFRPWTSIPATPRPWPPPSGRSVTARKAVFFE